MVTNKTIYGATALVYIAVHGNGKYIGLSEVAEKHQIPLRFLEQVFSRLKGKRLVNASRGAGGGYSLARGAEKISLAELRGRPVIIAPEGAARREARISRASGLLAQARGRGERPRAVTVFFRLLSGGGACSRRSSS